MIRFVLCCAALLSVVGVSEACGKRGGGLFGGRNQGNCQPVQVVPCRPAAPVVRPATACVPSAIQPSGTVVPGLPAGGYVIPAPMQPGTTQPGTTQPGTTQPGTIPPAGTILPGPLPGVQPSPAPAQPKTQPKEGDNISAPVIINQPTIIGQPYIQGQPIVIDQPGSYGQSFGPAGFVNTGFYGQPVIQGGTIISPCGANGCQNQSRGLFFRR